MITNLILLCSTLQIGLTYFTNVLQQCGCSQISEIGKSPFCSATSIKSCSNFNTTSECLSNYPGMECVWSNSTCTQFSSCSKLIVSDPTDCKKQLFGVCSYNPEALMNQDGTFNCTDTIYQKCANITADYLCVGAFETRYKMCDWQKNKCGVIDTEKCSSFPNQQSCKYFDCYWGENNKCRQKKCDDINTQSDCIKGVKTEFSEGYDICQWNDGKCSSLDDTNKLTSETCYTGSLYTYSWQERFKKCVKCTKISNVPVITRFWNATYCGLLYSTYSYSSSACVPKIRESYTLTVIINILIIYQNGTYFYTDDVTIYLVEKITIIYENNTIMFPNGTYCFDNGTLLEYDGKLTDNACVTDIDTHLTGYFGSTGVITNYTEKVVRVIQSERVLIIFKSGTYIQISKTILKIYMSMHVTIILPDKSYKQPNGDWCYNNFTQVYENGTMVPNGCLDKPVEQAYLGYYEDNLYVTFPQTIPNPYLVDIVEIFIVIYLNGTKITASNIYIFENVTIIFQNNTVILPDSSFCFINGTRRHSDGTLEDGICPTNIDVYSYGYFNETKYYDFSGNEKDIKEYKPTVVEETLDITIIFQNGTFVSTQNVVEVQQYVDLEVTIIYPNETAVYPNKTICDSSGTVIQPDGTRYENSCWRKKDTYYRGYYSSSGNYVTYTKPVPNPSNYQTTVIFSNGTKVYTTNVTQYQNVTIIYKNSTVVQPNGTIHYYNGTVQESDGTKYQTNTYVDRSTYYQGYYSSSGTYVQYQSTYTYSYYYYGYTYYYYDYDYDYQYYDPQDTYYSTSTTTQTTTEVNTTKINDDIIVDNNPKKYNSDAYTSQYCTCSKFSNDVCTKVGYCKLVGNICTEKACGDFSKEQCLQYELLSGCQWNGVCRSYAGCTETPVSYLSDCLKMGRYSCTLSYYGDLKFQSTSYLCENYLITTSCYGQSQASCYGYAISRSERCIWYRGQCSAYKIGCDRDLPRDACLLFDCYFDESRWECRDKICTDIKDKQKCNVLTRYTNYHILCGWYENKCYNVDYPAYLNQTTCSEVTYGTYYFDGLQCTQCYQLATSGFILPLAILVLQLAI